MALSKLDTDGDRGRLAIKLKRAAEWHEKFDQSALAADIRAGMEKGAALAAQVAKDEAAWIAAGKDAAAEFNAKYLKSDKK
jgi:hypothetical protein